MCIAYRSPIFYLLNSAHTCSIAHTESFNQICKILKFGRRRPYFSKNTDGNERIPIILSILECQNKHYITLLFLPDHFSPTILSLSICADSYRPHYPCRASSPAQLHIILSPHLFSVHVQVCLSLRRVIGSTTFPYDKSLRRFPSYLPVPAFTPLSAAFS